jgi:riboflavin kinase
MCLGTNPMFGDTKLEIHILNKYEENFYGEILDVTVTHFIRKMKDYDSIDLLIQDIKKDIKIVQEIKI